ncbi:MAG TPA: branched-chain amino acid transaminase [Candidatus Eisenbacteria bacterium]
MDRSTPALPRWAYRDGRIVPYREASFGLLTHALNYGTGLFAGLRGYWNAEERQLFVFRPEDHFRRFLESARLLRMELAVTPADLTRGLLELLRAEDYRENIYIRPLAFYGDESIGVRLHGLTPVVGMAAVPFGSYLGRNDGVHVMISSWTRVSDNVIPARGKFSGSYVNSAFAKTDAVLAGFDEALLLNEHGHVCEGSVENVFMLKGGLVVTPPVTDDVLEGFTRATVIHLLREELGQTVVERSIDRTELYLADEVFLTGTGAEISPVTRIDHRPVGTGTIGGLATTLRAKYHDVTRGRVARYRPWCRAVHAPAVAPSEADGAAAEPAGATRQGPR